MIYGKGQSPAEKAAAAELRRWRGLKSKEAGEYFEALIDAALTWYEIHDIACIEKTPEPTKQLRAPDKQGRFLACYTKAAQPDYKGTMIPGRSVVFEAKHTDDEEKIRYDRVTPEQNERLTKHHAMGAVAFVLVSFGLQDFYGIPWPVWRDMKATYGRKYITKQECEPWRVQFVSGVLKILDGLGRW